MDSLGQCKQQECTEPVYSRSRARGLCYRHYWQDYNQRNAEKRKEQTKKWRDANPDYWRNKDPEKKKAADKRYGEKNKEARAEKERLRRIAKADQIREYRLSEQGKATASKARNARRARVADTVSEVFSDADMLEKYGTDCYLCLTPIDLSAPRRPGVPGWERGLHREHVIPLAEGGEDTLANCRPAHGKCNLTKGRKSSTLES